MDDQEQAKKEIKSLSHSNGIQFKAPPKFFIIISVVFVLLVGLGIYLWGTKNNQAAPQALIKNLQCKTDFDCVDKNVCTDDVCIKGTCSNPNSIEGLSCRASFFTDGQTYFCDGTGQCVYYGPIKPGPLKTDETANWKTYVNENLKFSVKYPNSWSEKAPVANNDTTLVYLNSDESIGQGSEPIKYYVWITAENLPNVQMSRELIGEHIVYKTDQLPSRSGALNAFITRDDKKYVSISLTPYDLKQPFPSQDKYVNIFNQILDTFKFTDQKFAPTPTPLPYQIIQGNSVNTYMNNVYNFSFNFPKSLFIYNSQSNNEYAGFLEKQGNINAIRMTVEIFKNPNNLTLEEVEAKYNLKVSNNQAFDLEKTAISGKEAIIVAGNKSMRQLCNYDDDQQRRVALAALVKGSNFVLIFSANNTCDTFKTDWFSPIISSIRL